MQTLLTNCVQNLAQIAFVKAEKPTHSVICDVACQNNKLRTTRTILGQNVPVVCELVVEFRPVKGNKLLVLHAAES